MPKALSIHPEPYRHDFPRTPVSEIYTGWATRRRTIRSGLNSFSNSFTISASAMVMLKRRRGCGKYGTSQTSAIGKGTREEYFKLYDFTVDAVLRAFPEARIGGPETTGPGNAKAADFLRAFLEHCAHQKNYANGRIGSRLDFISFHPKGSPTWQGDHVQMGISHQLAAIEQGFKIIASFPEWQNTPIILGESDPEGCAACSAKDNPQNSYRNGALYGAYTVEALSAILDLARREHVNFHGSRDLGVEFEDQPYFAGFRELATNGVDKPVLNAFRMLGLLGNERVKVTSSGGTGNRRDLCAMGFATQPDINAIASRKRAGDRDSGLELPRRRCSFARAASIDLVISGLPKDAKRGLLEHFRVDSDHSNAFTAWKEMGSPQSPLQPNTRKPGECGPTAVANLPGMDRIPTATVHLQFTLPRQGLSLLRLAW